MRTDKKETKKKRVFVISGLLLMERQRTKSNGLARFQV